MVGPLLVSPTQGGGDAAEPMLGRREGFGGPVGEDEADSGSWPVPPLRSDLSAGCLRLPHCAGEAILRRKPRPQMEWAGLPNRGRVPRASYSVGLGVDGFVDFVLGLRYGIRQLVVVILADCLVDPLTRVVQRRLNTVEVLVVDHHHHRR